MVKSEVSQILHQIENGDQHAASQLLPLVYEELRRLASNKMAQEKQGHTLQPTALVHEAFVRLVSGEADGDDPHKWDGRGHFFAAAAESMRRILVESARRRNAQKRGGGMQRCEFTEDDAILDHQDDATLLSLDDALTKLAAEDAELAKLVQLRYFTGLTIEETADVLGVSARTVKRHWTYARAWLRRAMDAEE
ncbi:RNA polymerase sigma factor SigL [Stieleria maiorica]|uniref:RNA polymerase sigma factor SigL n=1 Tax=Stieleria maiorica TaxID=2795974 RepID=A0A5B9M5C2_9BACT|nr:ECF-type sigma factor [Stieleria maiorica]QEF96398.1 RNA polymerase sigma factor SigL [Stieleria maiorica]